MNENLSYLDIKYALMRIKCVFPEDWKKEKGVNMRFPYCVFFPSTCKPNSSWQLEAKFKPLGLWWGIPGPSKLKREVERTLPGISHAVG